MNIKLDETLMILFLVSSVHVTLHLMLQILLRFKTSNSYFGFGYGQADSSQRHLAVHQPTRKLP